MSGKKQPGRFTIQFNAADPQQRQVIELLNQQGRRKAVFLTCAVLAYCGQGTAPAIPPPSVEPAMIEQIVQRVLQQNRTGTPAQLNGTKAAEPASRATAAPAPQQSVSPPLSLLADDASDLPDTDLAAICDTIDAFRR